MAAEATEEQPKRLELRKYPNRRYYDSTRSRHVTLEEIYSLIRDGYEIRVTDSKSGQDITAKVLAQIIIDLDPLKLGVFPVPLLHRLLRSNQQLVNDFVHKWFSQPLAAFLDSQRSFEQYIRQAMGMRSAGPTVADWAGMMWAPFNPMTWGRDAGAAGETPGDTADSPPEGGARRPTSGQSSAAPAPSPAGGPPARPYAAAAPTNGEPAGAGRQDVRQSLEELRGQLAELRQQLATAPRDREPRAAPATGKGRRDGGRKTARETARKTADKGGRKGRPGTASPR